MVSDAEGTVLVPAAAAFFSSAASFVSVLASGAGAFWQPARPTTATQTASVIRLTPASGPEAMLVRCWPLDAIDHEDVNTAARRFERDADDIQHWACRLLDTAPARLIVVLPSSVVEYTGRRLLS